MNDIYDITEPEIYYYILLVAMFIVIGFFRGAR